MAYVNMGRYRGLAPPPPWKINSSNPWFVITSFVFGIQTFWLQLNDICFRPFYFIQNDGMHITYDLRISPVDTIPQNIGVTTVYPFRSLSSKSFTNR